MKETLKNYTTDYDKNEFLRHKSWNYCYNAFGENKSDNELALNLGFYLASWGMYRGSSGILNHSYKIHLGVIPIFKRFANLRKDKNSINYERNKAYAEELAKYYKTEGLVDHAISPTDTLLTKIILGTTGSLPAYDDFFCTAIKKEKVANRTFNEDSVKRLNVFIEDHKEEIEFIKKELKRSENIEYSSAKIIDMYFWQKGFDIAFQKSSIKHPSFAPHPKGEVIGGKRYELVFEIDDRDKNKEILLIMKNPSFANEDIGDRTSNRTLNYIYKNVINSEVLEGIGKVTILNLIPIVDVDASNLQMNKSHIIDKKNIDLIKERCSQVNKVIIAWGDRPDGLYNEWEVLKKKVFEIFKENSNDVYFVKRMTGAGNPLHGQVWGYKDELINYNEYIVQSKLSG